MESRPFSYQEGKMNWADVNIKVDGYGSFEITSENESEEDCSENVVRPIPVLEIWKPSLLNIELLALPDGDELKELITNEAISETLTKNKETAILLSSWMGKSNILRALINDNVSVDTKDKFGRSALHLSSYAGHTESTWLLVQFGAKVNNLDLINHVTPLHCAASMGHLSCLRVLLKHGAHVNMGIEKRSPLHYAVQNLAVDCAKELLENNAIPNTPQVYSEAPLHVAATLGNTEIIKLLLKYGAAVNVQSGDEKLTPLHLAAEQGYPTCVQQLITGGALVNSTNRKKQTPLHLAVFSQCLETSEILLENGANPNAADCDGRTPLHCATVSAQRPLDCVKSLLKYGADPNYRDAYGYTPVHSAALNEFSSCVVTLLSNGGDVTARTKGGISALNFITKKTPEVMPVYISRLDNAIKLNGDIGDVDCQLKMDFRVLVPTIGNQETSLLTNFIEVGQKPVLEHPLCETFLLLKWRTIREFFLFSLTYQLIFVILYSCYIYGVYLKNCPSVRSSSRIQTKDTCFAKDIYIDMGHILLVLNTLLLFKELFQLLHSSHTYVLEWENYLQWAIIISVFGCVHPRYQMSIREFVFTWQHHVAAISIFLAWVELMLIVARFPTFGIYVQMFTTVSINFFKFMCAYFYLIVAFTLSFGVIFANYPSFKQLEFVFFKVIMMMSGELEFEDVFYSDTYPLKYPYTAHFAYLVFVILVTIVLSNLLVGLAVSDIQGLQKSANLDRLVRQVRLMAHLEGMLFSKLLKWVPPKVMKFLYSRALLMQSQRDFTLDIRPNDPRENRIPKNLIENAFKLAIKKSDKKSFKRNLQRSKNYNKTLENDLINEITKIIKLKLEKK